jgi:hypothetical protein
MIMEDLQARGDLAHSWRNQDTIARLLLEAGGTYPAPILSIRSTRGRRYAAPARSTGGISAQASQAQAWVDQLGNGSVRRCNSWSAPRLHAEPARTLLPTTSIG